ncbi:hypothetical protein A4D02_34225 [Niastella koreensis]|uniref:Uncharacterized protein n=2 Tax=Niastella koreensis TaxID=354356 RepID=G8TDD4_NIAKG|nr:carboxypeptidase-like regulatory domain-containing protein [Niastella koreensis]AEV99374.1 hypothetical protein Niako_3044 [Niastella koreensis GR20-10]OQP45228.1 hypothetical protein A4D02_34225 [Niastella koreensis]
MKLLLLPLFLLLYTPGFCQNIILNGKVVDESGQSISGALISINGLLGEATSDQDGRFVLKLSKTVKPGTSIVVRCDKNKFNPYIKNIVASNEQIIEIKLAAAISNEFKIDTIYHLASRDESKMALEILVSNFTNQDIWLKELKLYNLVESSQSGHLPFYHIETYEVIIDSITQIKINDTAAKGNLNGRAFEQMDTAWAYKIKGNFEFVNSNDEQHFKVNMQMPLVLKLPKNDKTRIRMNFSSAKKVLLQSKGNNGTVNSSPLVKKLLRTTLITDRNKSISFSSDDDYLIEKVVNSTL